MSRLEKLLEKLRSGTADASFSFEELRYLLSSLGFEEHVRGGHHIFGRSGVEEQINIQRYRTRKDAKPYQVRQVRRVLLRYEIDAELNVTKYEVDIFWSDEDQLFIAEVPELPGCMAHGDTREEALRNAEEAIDFWIEVAMKRGREIPEPRGRKLAVA